MKNLVNLLIGVSVASVIIAIISKFVQSPISRVEPRGLVAFAAVLLLLAIALSVKK